MRAGLAALLIALAATAQAQVFFRQPANAHSVEGMRSRSRTFI